MSRGKPGSASSAFSSDANASRRPRTRVDQRLDPERVASEHEPPPARIPQREGEHPAQVLDERRPALLVEMHEHLDVGAGAEAVATALEPPPQRAVVVELAVGDHVDRAVLVRDRLPAADRVDEREPADREAGVRVEVVAGAVGPAVRERRAHHGEFLSGRRRAAGKREQARDPAHQANLQRRRHARRRRRRRISSAPRPRSGATTPASVWPAGAAAIAVPSAGTS